MIDGPMLVTLNESDLHELGIENKFHRRRMCLKIDMLKKKSGVFRVFDDIDFLMFRVFAAVLDHFG